MSDKIKLAALYAAIPSFTCLEGCSDCCGPVPMAKVEWQAMKLLPRASDTDCLTCAYLVDGKCSAYSNRPYLCRLFGATLEAKMKCPHSCGPEHPLTTKQTEVLFKRYVKLIGDGPAAYTANITI